MKDLTGQRFGRLVAIEPTDRRVDQLVVWRCRCDCGRECEVASSSLIKGNTRSCGCLHADAVRRDIAGRRFGKLVALEPTDKRSNGTVVWRCRCDCGAVCEAPLSMLTSGKKASCGCLKADSSHTARKDLAGRRFGKLVAVRPVGRRNRYVLWECSCDCGGTRLATTNQLTSGKATSCGCGRKGRPSREGSGPCSRAENLKGMRFGDLVVQRRVGRSGSYAVWECRCRCGAVVEAKSGALKSGNKRSCGCLKPGGRSALSNKRFGSLVCIDRTGEGEWETAVWRCLCDCNRVCYVEARSLTDGTAASCPHCSRQ